MEKNQLKIKYKIGGIEFEAEGPADIVEQQRIAFISGVLPAAVEAMNNTRFVDKESMYIEGSDPQMLYAPQLTSEDLSRTSLASYINQKGVLSDQDFVLFAAYFDECKNGVKAFSSETVKKYYADARRKLHSNFSVLLGHIMETPPADGGNGKCFTLTAEGIRYVEEYTPKMETVEKSRVKHVKLRQRPTLYIQI